MISLKRYLDEQHGGAAGALLSGYRSLLDATAECGSQVCPPTGAAMRISLLRLLQAVTEQSSAAQIASTEREAERELAEWRDRTADYFRQKASEVKELLITVAHAAESLAERDQRYSSSFTGLTQHLQAISELEDVSKLRAGLIQSVGELRLTVERMNHENRASVDSLQSEVVEYRTRLEESERAAGLDPLTGIANRRRLDAELADRVRAGKPFGILMADVNGLKETNDRLGHLAGDELLRMFAAELGHAVRGSDLVGRWGGDEFLVILNGDQTAAEKAVQRIRQWVVGDYNLAAGGGRSTGVASGTPKVAVSAALGVGLWTPGKDIAGVIHDADEAMYRDKKSQRSSQQR